MHICSSVSRLYSNHYFIHYSLSGHRRESGNEVSTSVCYTKSSFTCRPFLIRSVGIYAHTKKRLVVVTTEWLPWLHDLCWYQRLIVQNNQILVSLLFPPLFLIPEWEKKQGNWLSYTVSLYYHFAVKMTSYIICSHSAAIGHWKNCKNTWII